MSTCYICLQPINQKTTLMNCGHSFCSVCIEQWFMVNEACPRCKIRYDGMSKLIFKKKPIDSSAFCPPCKEVLLVCQMTSEIKLGFSDLVVKNRHALCLKCTTKISE